MTRGPVNDCTRIVMQPNLIQDCIDNHGADAENATSLVICMANALQHDVGSRLFSRSIMLVFSAAMVFFMQAGFAMLCAGAVRKKNIQNTLLKNLLDACGASVAYFCFGYAFSFGEASDVSSLNTNKTFVGNGNFFMMNVEDFGFWLFQYAFSAASATIIAGTLAERCQMMAYFGYSVALVGWVYPIIVHTIWSPKGFLSANSPEPLFGVGMIDFAGSGVVHLTGGVTALFATMILGPRRGRFHDETGRKLDIPREFPGHSMSLQMLGTFILWFGWYGFNCGSALLDVSARTGEIAALAGVNTTLSGGAAGIVALFVNLWMLERYTGEPYFDLKYAMNGALCGLVAITGPCGVIEPWAAVVVGIVAGFLYNVGSKGLIRLRLDDAVDAIPVHMVNGMWGLISVGLFASPDRIIATYGTAHHPGLFYTWREGRSDGTLLGVQIIGILFIIVWVGVFMFPFFVWLDWQGWFRSDPLEEIVGLDTSYHGGLALLAGEDEVNPEYISAFKQKRDEDLRRRSETNPRLSALPSRHQSQPGSTDIIGDGSGGYDINNEDDKEEEGDGDGDVEEDYDDIPIDENGLANSNSASSKPHKYIYD